MAIVLVMSFGVDASHAQQTLPEPNPQVADFDKNTEAKPITTQRVELPTDQGDGTGGTPTITTGATADPIANNSHIVIYPLFDGNLIPMDTNNPADNPFSLGYPYADEFASLLVGTSLHSMMESNVLEYYDWPFLFSYMPAADYNVTLDIDDMGTPGVTAVDTADDVWAIYIEVLTPPTAGTLFSSEIATSDGTTVVISVSPLIDVEACVNTPPAAGPISGTANKCEVYQELNSHTVTPSVASIPANGSLNVTHAGLTYGTWDTMFEALNGTTLSGTLSLTDYASASTAYAIDVDNTSLTDFYIDAGLNYQFLELFGDSYDMFSFWMDTVSLTDPNDPLGAGYSMQIDNQSSVTVEMDYSEPQVTDVLGASISINGDGFGFDDECTVYVDGVVADNIVCSEDLVTFDVPMTLEEKCDPVQIVVERFDGSVLNTNSGSEAMGGASFLNSEAVCDEPVLTSTGTFVVGFYAVAFVLLGFGLSTSVVRRELV